MTVEVPHPLDHDTSPPLRRRATALRAAAPLLGAALIAAPVLIGIVYTAAVTLGVAGAGSSEAGGGRVLRLLSERATWEGLAFTLWIATISTVAATAGAVFVAIAFRGSGLADRGARALAALPLPVPHLVAGLLGVWILAQSGLVGRIAFAGGLIDSPGAMPALVYDRAGIGLALTMAWKEFAFLSVVAVALLAARGAELEEAARTLGAGPVATFRHITWPVLWRGLLPAVVAVFIFVAGSYEAAALLAPSDPLVLPLLVAERASDPDLNRRADAYAISLLLLGIGVVAAVMHEWARARWTRLLDG